MADPGTAVAGGAIIAFIFLFFLAPVLIGILSILSLVFWIFMVIDVAQRKFKNENDKILWILVVVLAGIIGAIIYYFMIKKPDKH